MKKILLTLLFCAIGLFAVSAPIDVNKAHQIAANFMAKKSGLKANKELTLAYTGLNNSAKGEQATFYVFTSKKSNGFVIAAADDLLPAILGYSEEGVFDMNNLPSNFRYWLSFYEHSIPTIIEKGEKAHTPQSTKSVEPLLRDMAWDQGAPFNNLAPKSGDEATVTGCVATAMAQIMRYHRWPVQGKGTVSYTTRTLKKPLTQDLGAKPFDWDNMPGIYSSASTEAQKAAVAQLMYYAGVSVKMDYDIPANGGSGAYSSDVPKALVENFNYSIGIELLYRDAYLYSEWAEVIKAELDAKRPVYYAGGSPQGGHAFVCDGYDENGLFHINWGWSGMSNGYFSLLEMNPDAQGIGAGGGGGYINGQKIITGIRPYQTGDTNAPAYFVFETLSSSKQKIGKAETTTINITQFWNYSALSAFTGSLGVALYNANGDLSNLLIQESITNPIMAGYGAKETSFDNVPFTNVANGTYRLHLVSKTENSNTWMKIKSLNNNTNYIIIEVTDTEIIFSSQSTNTSLTLDGPLGLPEKVYTNKPVKASMTLKNEGPTEYSSFVGISVTQESKEEVVIYEKVIIPAGATHTFSFTANSFANTTGIVTVKTLYDIHNGANSLDTLSGVLATNQIEIHTSSYLQAPLPILQSMTSTKSTVAIGEEFEISAQFISTDSHKHFEASLVVFIFKPEGGNSVGYLGYNPYFVVAPNETVNLSIPKSLFITPGNYILAFFYKPVGGDWTQYSNKYVQIQLTEHANPVTDPTEEQEILNIYPNPASDIISINGLKSTGNIRLINMQGQEVLHKSIENNEAIAIGQLSSGIYIAVVTSKEGTVSHKVKIIKQ